jgi:hypothetical protein
MDETSHVSAVPTPMSKSLGSNAFLHIMASGAKKEKK